MNDSTKPKVSYTSIQLVTNFEKAALEGNEVQLDAARVSLFDRLLYLERRVNFLKAAQRRAEKANK